MGNLNWYVEYKKGLVSAPMLATGWPNEIYMYLSGFSSDARSCALGLLWPERFSLPTFIMFNVYNVIHIESFEIYPQYTQSQELVHCTYKMWLNFQLQHSSNFSAPWIQLNLV